MSRRIKIIKGSPFSPSCWCCEHARKGCFVLDDEDCMEYAPTEKGLDMMWRAHPELERNPVDVEFDEWYEDERNVLD